MKKILNLFFISRRENKRNNQNKILLRILCFIIFILKNLAVMYAVIYFMRNSGSDEVSLAALKGVHLLIFCALIIFSLCFFVIHLLKLQDIYTQFRLFTILGYTTGYILFYTMINWYITMFLIIIVSDFIVTFGGLWILKNIIQISIPISIIVSAIGYSTIILLLYISILSLLQYLILRISTHLT